MKGLTFYRKRETVSVMHRTTGPLKTYKARGWVNAWLVAGMSVGWFFFTAYMVWEVVASPMSKRIFLDMRGLHWLFGGGVFCVIGFWLEALLPKKTKIYNAQKRASMSLPLLVTFMLAFVFTVLFLHGDGKRIMLNWPPTANWMYAVLSLYGVYSLASFFVAWLWQYQTKCLAKKLGTYTRY